MFGNGRFRASGLTPALCIGVIGALILNAMALFSRKDGGTILPAISSQAHAEPAKSRASERRTEIVDVAQKLSPAIVSVGAQKTTYFVSPFRDFFSDFAVYPYQERIPYLGSGVIIDPKGVIVTNYHVIEESEGVFVTLMDGREFPAKVLDADRLLDVALLQIDAKDLQAAKLGDSDDMMVGEWVLAMGNPFGNLIGDPHPTVTVGVVSALRRTFRGSGNPQRVYQDMIQTDAAINPGNSGGALINASGELVGINTFIVSRSGGSIGLGFAIPINRVKSVVNEILAHGRIRPRLVDFSVQNANERIARMVGAKSTQGAVVSEIARGGPAQKSGMRIGDIVTKVDGRDIKDANDLTLSVFSSQVGTEVKLSLDREGKPVDVTYTISEAKQ
ncbi:MAG: trypsin-like peptidase domain-containing protein [Candidatus Sumerlaeaceae bacterium]|nr:trypsin-like peptidase domain-containing protein [Candidatus Sumerlaeaceae bacterium]